MDVQPLSGVLQGYIKFVSGECMKIEDNIRFIMLRNGTNAQIYLLILI